MTWWNDRVLTDSADRGGMTVVFNTEFTEGTEKSEEKDTTDYRRGEQRHGEHRGGGGR